VQPEPRQRAVDTEAADPSATVGAQVDAPRAQLSVAELRGRGVCRADRVEDVEHDAHRDRQRHPVWTGASQQGGERVAVVVLVRHEDLSIGGAAVDDLEDRGARQLRRLLRGLEEAVAELRALRDVTVNLGQHHLRAGRVCRGARDERRANAARAYLPEKLIGPKLLAGGLLLCRNHRISRLSGVNALGEVNGGSGGREGLLRRASL
jgi:hypothetical protein